MPRENRISFLFSGNIRAHEPEIVKLLARYLSHNGQFEDEGEQQDIRYLLQLIASKARWGVATHDFSSPTITLALKATVKYDNAMVFEEALPLFFSTHDNFQLAKAEGERRGTKWFDDR